MPVEHFSADEEVKIRVHLEEKLVSDVFKSIANSAFFSRGRGYYVRVEKRSILELGRKNPFIRLAITNAVGETVCKIEKVVKYTDEGVNIHHRNTHNSRNGKMQETHITPFLGTYEELVEEVTDSIVVTLGALLRLQQHSNFAELL